MSASLPAAANLEQLRKQAKDLLRAHRAGDKAARCGASSTAPAPERRSSSAARSW